MKYKQTTFFFRLSSVLFIALLGTFFAQAQSVHQVQFKQQTAMEIIKSLEAEFELTFNYSHQNLPQGTFSFSCDGSREEVLGVAFSSLDRNYILLDEGVYSIQAKRLEATQKRAPIQLQGRIENSYGETLTAAVVWLPTLEQATTSDTKGNFQLEGYFSKNEVVEVRYLGYKTLQTTVKKLLESPNTPLILPTASHVLGEVIVSNRIAWQTEDSEHNSQIIRTDAMPLLAGKGDNDALSAAQLVAGVYNSAESLTEVQMRGSPPDQTTFEWNDIPIVQSSHFYGKLSSINPFMVDKIEITRNGTSAEDDGQAGGSILFSSNNQPADSLEVKLYGDFLYSNIGLRLPLFDKKMGLQLAWRNAHPTNGQNRIFREYYTQSNQNGELKNVEFYKDSYNIEVALKPQLHFRDFSASLQYHIHKNSRLYANFIYLQNEFTLLHDYPDRPDELDSLSTRTSGYSLRFEHDWTNKLQTRWNLAQSNYRNEYQYFQNLDEREAQDRRDQWNRLHQRKFQVDTRYTLKNGYLLGGYTFQHLESTSFYRLIFFGQESTPYDDDFANAEHALFLQGRLQPIPNMQVELGLRWSHIRSAYMPNLWEPRLHFSYLLTNAITLHAHYGQQHQLLNRWESYTRHALENSFWTVADELRDIPSFFVQNRQTSIGLRYAKHDWKLNFALFNKRIVDVWTEALDFSRDENPYFYSDIFVQGFELEWNYSTPRFSMIWAYEYTNDRLEFSNAANLVSPYFQPHRLSFFQALKWKKLELSAHWRFAVGRLYSEATGLNNFDDNIDPSLTFDEIFEAQVPSYHSLDLGLQYRFSTHPFDGRIGTSISNVYNRVNILRNRYFVDFTTTPESVSLWSQTGLPRVVNVFLEVQF